MVLRHRDMYCVWHHFRHPRRTQQYTETYVIELPLIGASCNLGDQPRRHRLPPPFDESK